MTVCGGQRWEWGVRRASRERVSIDGLGTGKGAVRAEEPFEQRYKHVKGFWEFGEQ